MASADVQILGSGSKPAPLDYTLPSGSELLLKAVRASFDGTGAGGAFLPSLEIIAPGGGVVAESETATTVAAGGSADVSWFPSRRPCPPGGICPGYPGADVCGGIAITGAFATGTGGGLTTSLFVNQTVTCDSLVVVVGVAASGAGDGGAIITSCTDTHNNLYNPGISSIESELVGPSDAVEASLAIAYVGANTIHAGDSITVTWDTAVNVVDSACLAVALTNVGLVFSDSANGVAFPGTGGTTATALEWGPSIGLPTANLNGFVGAVLSFVGTRPNVGFSNTQGTLIDAIGSAQCAVGVSLIQSLTDGDTFEPGYTGGAWDVAVANYTELIA